jgi:hypothetical protein
MLRLTARSKEEGAPKGLAFPFAWPGAWTFAPTKATPKTSTVTAPIAVFAERARARARSIRDSFGGSGETLIAGRVRAGALVFLVLLVARACRLCLLDMAGRVPQGNERSM